MVVHTATKRRNNLFHYFFPRQIAGLVTDNVRRIKPVCTCLYFHRDSVGTCSVEPVNHVLPHTGNLQRHLIVHALGRTASEEMISFLQPEHLFQPRNDLRKRLGVQLLDAVSEEKSFTPWNTESAVVQTGRQETG